VFGITAVLSTAFFFKAISASCQVLLTPSAMLLILHAEHVLDHVCLLILVYTVKSGFCYSGSIYLLPAHHAINHVLCTCE
jgi:hypothetical protein